MNNPNTDIQVVRTPEKDRFEALAGGNEVLGFIDYVEKRGTLYVTHTEVVREGMGVGSALARGVLDQLLEAEAEFVVTCPFIKSWVRKHPEYEGRVTLRDQRRRPDGS